MDSNSASEGEIIESENENEKATKDQSANNRKEINRRLRDAFSPSPESDLSHRSPASPRSRERSGSPRRADRDLRGWKRHRDNGHYSHIPRQDSRQSHAYYESSHDRGPSGRSQTFVDRDGKVQRSIRQAVEDHGSKQPVEKKRRTRSRSPRGVDVRNDDVDKLNQSRDGFRNRKSQRPLENGPYTEESSSTKQGGGDTNQISANGLSTSAVSNASAVQDSARDELLSEPKSEEMSIEERRRRREAIKARYKAGPLLVQALQHGDLADTPTTSKPTSTAASSRSGSPDASTPSTPLHDSQQGSPPPIEISNPSDLANTATATTVGEVDEPSAADYDPAMDMQEDRKRGNQLQLEKTMSAPSNGKDTQADQTTPSSETIAKVAEPESKKSTTADDLFASDDEGDMFADVATSKDGISKAPFKAKELDMSLLDNWDDPDGYYRIILSELLDGRYVVQANLGKGMFSSVIRATDNQTNHLVAIKIIRNNETMLKAGTKEMEILQKLAAADPEDKKHVIRLERSFVHKGHLCMVFENLSINLREVLKKFGRDVGIKLTAVRSYAQQMFLALSLLRKCNILHADLKPDNILVNEVWSTLKICDLGSAADASENDITPYLVSRFYRAPEIILGIPYDFAIDMWSIGCTLFELATGKILFTGRTNNQMLRSIMECRGKFSLKMLKKAEFGAVHFDDESLHFRSVERDKITGRDVTKLINFVRPTRDLKTRLLSSAVASGGSGKQGLPEAEIKELNLFADLLDRCLALNPEKRITPTEALKHPFIHRSTGAGGGATKR